MGPFAHAAIPRLAGHDAARNTDFAAKADRFLGTDRWRRIYERRAADELTAARARRLYIDYFRYRLVADLGYRVTMTIDMGNEFGTPIYTMVFATDHDAGRQIMINLANARADLVDRRRDVRRRESAVTGGRPVP